MNNRITYLDFLKFIGISCIIIAHVKPTAIVFTIRNFDVVLMVIISSLLAHNSYEKYVQTGSWVNYITSRVKRLVIPTWIFMILYFIKCALLSGYFMEKEVYINSFLLTRYGIGYVWIILIYIYSAIMIPICYKVKNINIGTISAIIMLYVVYEVLYFYQIGIEYKFIETILYYFVPYGIVTFIGYNYYLLCKKHRFIIITTCMCLFVTMGLYYYNKLGSIQNIQISKYPPRIYYLSYGIAVSFILLEIFRSLDLKIYTNRIVCFVSKHSLWIYLWHILAIDIYNKFLFSSVWYIKFIGVYLIAITIVIIINIFLDKTKLDSKIKGLRYLRG